MARSKPGASLARVKSSWRMRASGNRSRAIDAVIGSASMPVNRRVGGDGLGNQGQEQARAAAGLEDLAAGETHPPQRRPDGADQELRRVVGILGRAGERRQLRRRDQLLQLLAELGPARRGTLALARRNRWLASSDAPKPVNRARCACSSAEAALPSCSIACSSRMAWRLSAARPRQLGARPRSPASR